MSRRGNNQPIVAFGRTEIIWSALCAIIAAFATALFTDQLPPPRDRMAIPYGLAVALGIWLAGMSVIAFIRVMRR